MFSLFAGSFFTLMCDLSFMLMEKVAIARGYQRAEPRMGPRLALVPSKANARAEEIEIEDYRLVHDRLAALERLADLRERGVVSDGEFTAEKALILGGSAQGRLLDPPMAAADQAAPRGPSLAGRAMRWPLLPVGLVAGLAFSYSAQPRETLRFLDEAMRLFGA